MSSHILALAASRWLQSVFHLIFDEKNEAVLVFVIDPRQHVNAVNLCLDVKRGDCRNGSFADLRGQKSAHDAITSSV